MLIDYFDSSDVTPKHIREDGIVADLVFILSFTFATLAVAMLIYQDLSLLHIVKSYLGLINGIMQGISWFLGVLSMSLSSILHVTACSYMFYMSASSESSDAFHHIARYAVVIASYPSFII